MSSSPAQAAGWGLKIGAEHGGGPEKQGFGVEKWVDKPSDGRKIAETTGKTPISTMNLKSNGKSRLGCKIFHEEVPIDDTDWVWYPNKPYKE